jgi:hypothetical protein
MISEKECLFVWAALIQRLDYNARKKIPQKVQDRCYPGGSIFGPPHPVCEAVESELDVKGPYQWHPDPVAVNAGVPLGGVYPKYPGPFWGEMPGENLVGTASIGNLVCEGSNSCFGVYAAYIPNEESWEDW